MGQYFSKKRRKWYGAPLDDDSVTHLVDAEERPATRPKADMPTRLLVPPFCPKSSHPSTFDVADLNLLQEDSDMLHETPSTQADSSRGKPPQTQKSTSSARGRTGHKDKTADLASAGAEIGDLMQGDFTNARTVETISRQELCETLVRNVINMQRIEWKEGDELEKLAYSSNNWRMLALGLEKEVRTWVKRWEKDPNIAHRLPEIAAEAINDFIITRQDRIPPPAYLRAFLPQMSYLTRRYGSRFIGTLKYLQLLDYFKTGMDSINRDSPGLISSANDIDAFRVFIWNMLVHNRFDFLKGGALMIVKQYQDVVLFMYRMWNEKLLSQYNNSERQNDPKNLYQRMRHLQNRMSTSVTKLLQLSFVHLFLAGYDSFCFERREEVRIVFNRIIVSLFAKKEVLVVSRVDAFNSVVKCYEDMKRKLSEFGKQMQDIPHPSPRLFKYSEDCFFFPCSYVDNFRIEGREQLRSGEERADSNEFVTLRDRLGLRGARNRDGSARIDAV